MPFYEYRCERCGREFESLVKSMDAPAPACDKCGSARVVKKPSVFGVGVGPARNEPSGGCASCAQGGTCPMAR